MLRTKTVLEFDATRYRHVFQFYVITVVVSFLLR